MSPNRIAIWNNNPPLRPRPDIIPSPQNSQAKLIICGYCEANQDADNLFCQSCGGPLNDDITNRRNGFEPKFSITAQEAADALSLLARI